MKTHLKDLSVKLQTIVHPVFTSCKIAQEFPTNEPKPQLIDNALCIILSVTSAMLVMLDTPVAICSYALMDIEARPRQCANTMIIDTHTVHCFHHENPFTEASHGHHLQKCWIKLSFNKGQSKNTH